MDNSTAIIIASCITVAGGIISFIANSLFNFFTNKRAIHQRFYYHMLPERVEFYKELSAAISKFMYEYPLLEFGSTFAFGNFLNELAEQFVNLLNRSSLCASKDVYRYFIELHKVIMVSRIAETSLLPSNETGNTKDTATKLKKDFLAACELPYQYLLAQIRVETGQEVIDKECFYLNKKAVKRLRRNYKKSKKKLNKNNKNININIHF